MSGMVRRKSIAQTHHEKKQSRVCMSVCVQCINECVQHS